jgi:tRNA-dihydrouridine synthase B
MGALFWLRWLGLPTSRCVGLPRISEMVAAEHYARGAQSRRAGPRSPCRSDCRARPFYHGAEAARLAQDSGAAMIDTNMGCPAKKVTNGYVGSHMRDMGLAISLIRATVAAVHIPMTLKMRLGWDEQTINTPELARVAEAEGIAMLTVHGRTRCQFYSAKADWTAIAEVKKAVSIPVAANGDCAASPTRHRCWRNPARMQ